MNKVLFFTLIGILATITGSVILWSQVSRPAPVATQHFQTNDSYRLFLSYPETWAILRRGNRILLWTTRAATEGRAEIPQLERLETTADIPDSTRPRDFAIITILLTSGIDESLASYADYVTQYAQQHPIIDNTTRTLPIQPDEVAALQFPYLVAGGQLFIELAPSQIATIAIRVDMLSTPDSVDPLKKDAIEIIISLQGPR